MLLDTLHDELKKISDRTALLHMSWRNTRNLINFLLNNEGAGLCSHIRSLEMIPNQVYSGCQISVPQSEK